MAYATSTYLAIMAIAASAVGTGVSVYSQNQQAKSQELAAKYNNDLAEAEAKNAELEAAERMKRQQIEKRQHMGRVRAELAAQGTLTTSGTPLAILGETSAMANLAIADAARASNMQAASYRSQGKMGLWEAAQFRSASNISNIGTGLQGLSSAAGSYYGYKQKGTF